MRKKMFIIVQKFAGTEVLSGDSRSRSFKFKSQHRIQNEKEAENANIEEQIKIYQLTA